MTTGNEVDEVENNQALVFDSAQELPLELSGCKRSHRKRGWLKNIVAIVIGIVAGIFLRVVIGIPSTLAFGTEEGLPLDIAFILEALTAFVAGAMAGSLVPRFGWLIGALTQLLKIVVTLVVLGFWIFFVVTGQELYAVIGLLRSPFTRLMVFAILIAGIGGALGEKYRSPIWSFFAKVFVVLGSIVGFICYGAAGLCYLYCLYRGGKALFEEHAILKAVLFLAIIGPVVSALFWLVFMGIFMLGAWLYEKIYDWYAPDIGLGTRQVL